MALTSHTSPSQCWGSWILMGLCCQRGTMWRYSPHFQPSSHWECRDVHFLRWKKNIYTCFYLNFEILFSFFWPIIYSCFPIILNLDSFFTQLSQSNSNEILNKSSENETTLANKIVQLQKLKIKKHSLSWNQLIRSQCNFLISQRVIFHSESEGVHGTREETTANRAITKRRDSQRRRCYIVARARRRWKGLHTLLHG